MSAITKISIHVSLAARDGLSINHSTMLQSLIELSIHGERGYGLTKYDVDAIRKLIPIWSDIGGVEMDRIFYDLVRDGYVYEYECHDGYTWFAMGLSYCGWDRSWASDKEALDGIIRRHLISIGTIPAERERPSGKNWELLRLHVFERDSFACTYCGASGVPLAVDHIHPFSKGGSDDESNLTTACQSCNSSKSDKTLSEWEGRS